MWAARRRVLAEGDSPQVVLFLSLLLPSLPRQSCHHHCHHHHQLLLLPPFRLLYLWLCPLGWKNLSSGPVDLEMEYLLRSARDKPCSPPAKGVGGKEFRDIELSLGYFLCSHSGAWSVWKQRQHFPPPDSLYVHVVPQFFELFLAYQMLASTWIWIGKWLGFWSHIILSKSLQTESQIHFKVMWL